MYQVCSTPEGKKILIPEEKLVDRKAVYGIVIHDNHILLMRSRNNELFWYPGGGIDDGESPEAALTREVLEETGVEIDIQKELLRTKNSFYSPFSEQGFLQEAVFFICTAEKNPERLTEHEVKDLESTAPEWYNIDELKEDEFQDYGFQILEYYNKSK